MLPRRPARAARAGLALYEPVEPHQRFAALVGRGLTRLRLHSLLPSTDRAEVVWPWWDQLVNEVVEPLVGPVGAVAVRVPGNPRVSLLAMDALGRPVAFAKLLNSPTPQVAAAAGQLLATPRPKHFSVPIVLAEGEFGGRLYRLLQPLPEGAHRPPPYDVRRVWALVDEMHHRLRDLPRPDGVPDHYVPCHADLTPRNLRVASDRSWWLFDWDNVRWGPRLADELRYWSAWFAYRGRSSVARDAPRVLELLRRRGADDEIREAVEWPAQVRQTYRPIEPQLHAAVGSAVGGAV